MRAGRTLMIAGALLSLFFFSPFVSCGSTTMSGMQAFQESLPGQGGQIKDGILIILFPIVGVIGALIGYQVTQRVAQGADLRGLRSLSITVLVLALLTSCPIGVGFYDMQINRGRLQLEWGFYGSLLASLAMIWGGWELLSCAKQPVAAAKAEAEKRTCPACGAESTADQRFCMSCGATMEPPESPA
jgi:hypothetical protein